MSNSQENIPLCSSLDQEPGQTDFGVLWAIGFFWKSKTARAGPFLCEGEAARRVEQNRGRAFPRVWGPREGKEPGSDRYAGSKPLSVSRTASIQATAGSLDLHLLNKDHLRPKEPHWPSWGLPRGKGKRGKGKISPCFVVSSNLILTGVRM